MKNLIFLLIMVMMVLLQNSKAQNVGVGTISPKAAFNIAENKTVLFGADSNGLGNKLIWYGSKGAFRVGNTELDSWDFNKIGNFSMALGRSTSATGETSTSIGAASVASGRISTAMGQGSEASGYNSTAMGYTTRASGSISTAMGIETTAKSFGETVLGSRNTDYSPLSTTNWNPSDRLLVVGNGALLNNSDAMVILKNGNTGIGSSTPTEKLEVAGKIKTTNLQITNSAAIGKVLTSDGSGNASWATPVASSNYWTASGNNIFNNNIANVGIGESSPVFPLNFASGYGDKIALWGNATTTGTAGSSIGFGVQNAMFQIHSNQASDDIAFGYGSSSNFTEQMRIKGTGNVGIGTTTPTARLQIADSAVLFTGPTIVPTTTNYPPPAQGAGTRMMWYPQKAAFRVGFINGSQWDFNNIGKNSFASGYGTKATGLASTAMGDGSLASGEASTVIGGGNASGIASTAMGGGNASGDYATAMGQSSATGYASTAIGYDGIASGDYSMSMGNDIRARSFSELSIGCSNTDYTPLSFSTWNSVDRLFVIGNGQPNSTRSDAMVVLKNGNTGIGESNPAYKLQIGSSNNGLRIEGPATTGIAGSSALNIGGAGDIIVDAPGVAGGRFLIKENGNVGIGSLNPEAKLHIIGDEYVDGKIKVRNTSASIYGIIQHTGPAGNFHLDTYGGGGIYLNWFSGSGVNIGNGAGAAVASFFNSGNATLYGILTQTSDARLKKNIQPLQATLKDLEQINGYTYNWKDESKDPEQQTGLLAQEVQKIFPHLVKTADDGTLSINYIGLIPVMIESIKEQQKQIEALKRIVSQLLNR